MGAPYTAAFNNWKAIGGEMYVVFADIYAPGQIWRMGRSGVVYGHGNPL